MLYIRMPDHDLQFEWNEAHTVNVQRLDDASRDLDCYSIGSFADDAATLEEFHESVDEYIADMLGEIDGDMREMMS